MEDKCMVSKNENGRNCRKRKMGRQVHGFQNWHTTRAKPTCIVLWIRIREIIIIVVDLKASRHNPSVLAATLTISISHYFLLTSKVKSFQLPLHLGFSLFCAISSLSKLYTETGNNHLLLLLLNNLYFVISSTLIYSEAGKIMLLIASYEEAILPFSFFCK